MVRAHTGWVNDLTQRLSPSYGRVQSLSLSLSCVCVSVYVSCVRGFAVCAPARLPHCTVLSARPDRQIWCARSQPPYPVGSQSAARLEHVQPPCWTQTHLISYIRHRPRGGRPTDKARISTSRAATIAPRPSHITLNRPYSPSCVANRHISHHLAQSLQKPPE